MPKQLHLNCALSAGLSLLLALHASGQTATFQQVCSNSQNLYLTGVPHRELDKSWEQQYPMLIFDAAPGAAAARAAGSKQDAESAKEDRDDAVAKSDAQPSDKDLKQGASDAISHSNNLKRQAAKDAQDLLQLLASRPKLDADHAYQLYWKEAHDSAVSPLPNRSMIGKVYLTETVLILICNSSFGDGLDLNQTSVAAEGPQTELYDLTLHGAAFGAPVGIDKIYALEQKIGDNGVTIVNVTKSTGSGAGTDPLATAIVERHHRIRFSAGGGLLLTKATPTTYALVTTPTTVTTTTTTNTTVISGGVTTTVPPSTTVATTSGTAQYVLGTVGQNPQLNGIAGLTIYPFGHDTYPVASIHGVYTYAFKHPAQSFGIFVGTSVDTLGNFTVAPAYEVYSGVQLFAGPTWWSQSQLSAGVVACSGYGPSPSYTSLPTTNYTTNSFSPGATPSATMSTVTVTTNAVSGCANGDKATILSGSTVPVRTSLSPAWGFGVIFNTNLFKSFTGLGK